MDISVMVIGGGIGGLALAHGLRRAGVEVRVFERTHERDDWLQGYRIHINPDGARALQDLLPPNGWAAFLRAVSPGGGFGFVTDQGDDLLGLADHEINVAGAGPADRHYGIGRSRLREVLLDGLGDALDPGREFTAYELDGDHVIAHFTDGSSARSSVLIGADGANSRVRAQLLPRAAGRVDTGVLTIAGRCRSTAGLPPTLTGRANVVIPRGRGSLFTAAWASDTTAQTSDTVADPSGGATGASDGPAAAGDGTTPEQVLWGFSDATHRFPDDVERLDAEALMRIVDDRLRGWSPEFRDLVRRSDPATVNAFRVKSAVTVRVPPHPSGRGLTLRRTTDQNVELSTGRVTLLGDAIHSMTPMAGVGANTALRDAALLCRELTAAQRGEKPLLQERGRPVQRRQADPPRGAIEEYEHQMLTYGFAAVRLSLRNARQAAHSTASSRAFFRLALRLTAAVPPLRRRFARSLGD